MYFCKPIKVIDIKIIKIMKKTLLQELSRLQAESTNPNKDLLIEAIQCLDTARRKLQLAHKITLPSPDVTVDPKEIYKADWPLQDIAEAMFDTIIELDEHAFQGNETTIDFYKMLQQTDAFWRKAS